MVTKCMTGLSNAEVAAQIARGEINDYEIHIGRTYWQIVRDNIFNVFNIVLFVLVIIMISQGDTNNVIFASFSVVLNSILGLVQEIRARRALDRLAAMQIQDVCVLREGHINKLSITEVVKDDVIPVKPGDRIIVDGCVLSSDALEVDESLLTGEADAILKESGAMLYSGSFCVAGTGLMRATKVGANSTVNQLSRTAKAYRTPLTPTQQQINRLVQLALFGMFLLGPMTVVAGVASKQPLIEIVRNSAVLVTTFVPQGLILVTTISLTIGALRISRFQTLIQRVNAVESMANVNVLCFDKTGTLTRNELSVARVVPFDAWTEHDVKQMLSMYTDHLSHQNSTAAAIARYTNGATSPDAVKQKEIPFNSARKWGAVVFADNTLVLGAPERVLPNGHLGIEQARQFTTHGYRVIALAQMPCPPQSDHLTEARDPLALIVMSDQIREDICQTLHALQQQGIALKVISGDNIETVTAIATQAGLEITGAYTGEQIETFSENDLTLAVCTANVFARVEPHTKRKIIAKLRQQGAYVAMVGDGVNDVSAFKEANLAIAMNAGAQIAKDVADIVLLNNAMTTLPLVFTEGKQITQKIFATTKLFLTKNFYTILMFVFVGFMMLPFPTTPIQMSWLTFGVVNIPALLILTGWLRQPRMDNFNRDVLAFTLAAILAGALGSAMLYACVYLRHASGAESILAAGESAHQIARSTLLMYLSLYGLLVLWETHGIKVLVPSTWFVNRRAFWATVLLIAITILVPFLVPSTFSFVPLTIENWIIVLGMFFITSVGLHYLLSAIAVNNQHDLNKWAFR